MAKPRGERNRLRPGGRRQAVSPAARAVPGAGRRRDLAWAFGLILLAFLHRLIFLHANRDLAWPYTFFYEGDSETFFRYARALLAGQLYDSGLPFHPPGFAWALAGAHVLVGAGEAGARVPHAAVKSILALVGSLPVGLLYLLARPYLGRAVALLAALFCLYHFGLSVLAVAPVSEGLYLALLMLCLLLWSRLGHPLGSPEVEAGRRFRAGAALGLGFLLGALALVRAEGMLIGALLGTVGLTGSLWQRRSGKRSWRSALLPWALVALGWGLAVIPWTVRNAIRISAFNQQMAGQLAEPLPTFVPVTIYAPINLALANNPQAEGGFSRAALASHAGAPVLDLTDPEHLRFFLHGGEMAWEWIRSHPGDFARLAARKWALYLGAWRLGWTQWDWPGGLAGVRRPVDVFVPDSRAAYWIMPPFALLGLALCLATPGGPRRWATLVALIAAVGFFASALFFGYARLGLLLVPFGLTFSAAALAWLARLGVLLSRRDRGLSFALAPWEPARRLLAAVAIVAVVLLALELWGITEHRNFRATGHNVPGRGYLDRDQPVRLDPAPR